MPTDEERREVARRLRETGDGLGRSALLWYHIAKALGVRTATDGKTACNMLADLIEPSERACYYYDAETNHCRCYDTPQKAAEEMFGKMRHSTKEEADAYEAMLKSMSVEIHPVDHDALLALADDIDKQTDGSMFDIWLEDGHYIARRIREALGVK